MHQGSYSKQVHPKAANHWLASSMWWLAVSAKSESIQGVKESEIIRRARPNNKELIQVPPQVKAGIIVLVKKENYKLCESKIILSVYTINSVFDT